MKIKLSKRESIAKITKTLSRFNFGLFLFSIINSLLFTIIHLLIRFIINILSSIRLIFIFGIIIGSRSTNWWSSLLISSFFLLSIIQTCSSIFIRRNFLCLIIRWYRFSLWFLRPSWVWISSYCWCLVLVRRTIT